MNNQNTQTHGDKIHMETITINGFKHKVIEELNNFDIRKMRFNKIQKNHPSCNYQKGHFTTEDINGRGEYHIYYEEEGEDFRYFLDGVRNPRCGIEVMVEMVPIKILRTPNGNYSNFSNSRSYINGYGLTVKTLKDKCRMNGIKGYSKMRKLELVKVLIGM